MMLAECPDSTSAARCKIPVLILTLQHRCERLLIDADTGFAEKHQVLEEAPF
jgi:hypothetical protein